jgi:hypothetical protein
LYNHDAIVDGVRSVARAAGNLDLPYVDVYGGLTGPDGIHVGIRGDTTRISLPDVNIPNPFKGTNIDLSNPDPSKWLNGEDMPSLGGNSESVLNHASNIDPGEGFSHLAEEIGKLNGFDLTPEQAKGAYDAIINAGVDPNNILVNPDTGIGYKAYEMANGTFGISPQQGRAVFSPEALAAYRDYVENLKRSNDLVGV